MDCYYVSFIEKNFKNYLEELSEDEDNIYKFKFYRNTPRVFLDVDVKNITFSGNQEFVVLQAITFFDEQGINFYHTLFESALKHFRIKSIDDFKELGKDQFFSFMVSLVFSCEGPRLCLVESEDDDSCLEDEEEEDEE